MIRSPVCAFVGHVDHGKSSVIDYIAGTTIVKKEPGKITQNINAITIPISRIKKICGGLLDKLKIKINIPGILFIDTPGHASFTSLRKRGGGLADLAILVIDVNEGFKPQTLESIEILKKSKTPFIVAANKIDLINGFFDHKVGLLENIDKQSDSVKEKLDAQLYNIVNQFFQRFQLEAERFDRVDDYTKKIGIVPISAKLGIGIPELLMVLTGLTQRYLGKKLEVEVKGEGKGTILEIKEVEGLGTVMDVIIYDGTIKKDDRVVIGGLEKPIVTKVRVLLSQKPLSELKDKKGKFDQVKEVSAAAGIRLCCIDSKEVLSGMPIRVARKDVEKVKEEVQEEIEEVLIEIDTDGIIVKADTIGGLEALDNLLKEKGIKIRKATIGDITKKDIAEAKTSKDKINQVILGFNVKTEYEKSSVKLITHDVIYKIIEDYEEWAEKEKVKIEGKALGGLTRPFKITILAGCIFRQSNPCVVGVEVLNGLVKNGSKIMNKNGVAIGSIKSMQLEGKNISESKKGDQIAISLPGVTAGRQVFENDILYSDISEDEYRKFKKLKKLLNVEEKEILKEIADIKRREDSVWGV